ncbi:MAG TPA: GAF domain-containing protein [Burkholderiales bacterium]|nr:GAF domain-containing protein [Burkholderiales bacterium]
MPPRTRRPTTRKDAAERLKEALERQTATADVLRVISASPTDVNPVFDAILQSAVRLCDAQLAAAFRYDGKLVHMTATHNWPPEALEYFSKIYPCPPDPSLMSGRVILERSIVIVSDAAADPHYDPKSAATGHWRRMVGVPMLREGNPLGLLVVSWREPGDTPPRQIELLKTFADQAAIAIENVRLFNETKEALEQQVATGAILRVITASPGDIKPVLRSVAENAARLCEAKDVLIRLVEGDVTRVVEHIGPIPVPDGLIERPINRHLIAGRAILEGRTIHVPDVLDPAMREEYPEAAFQFQAAGLYRAVLDVPMMRDGKAVGVIVIRREEARPFSEQQIRLLQTFADQAVIAIENARLFNETKEALDQQKAAAEVLEAISSSIADAQPVFEKILTSCERLFEGLLVGLTQVRGDAVHLVAYHGPAGDSLRRIYPLPLSHESGTGWAILNARVAEFPDIDAEGVPRHVAVGCRSFGARSIIFAPMIFDGRGIGAIWIARRQPGAFSDKQLALLRTFADQAVIAVQNARLFNETREALRRQTATSEILQVIGRSISDTQPVFDAIVKNCAGLFTDSRVGLFLIAAEGLVCRASTGYVPEPMPLDRESGIGACVLGGRVIHLPDLAAAAERYPRIRQLGLKHGYRSGLYAPLVREGESIGAISVLRHEAGAFDDKDVGLLTTFASQAVIAIENARLFRDIQEKSRQLEEASRHKSQFLASMSHELRTPLNAILGFNEMILGGIYGDVPADMTEPLTDIQTSGKHLLRLINNVLDLAKIEAGRMELALADYSVQDTVAGVHATLRPLAAEKRLEFVTEVPPDIPLAHGDGGRITQCLMNLAGNSLKFTRQGRVAIRVEHADGVLRYNVTDTGIGIPPDKIGTLFTEFKQTDASIASEFGGSGLGLSITKKFIEMHGGRIWVDSQPGKGSAFRFEIPLRVSA